MISSNDLRPGVTIEYKDSVWQVIEFMHVKPGKGSAFVQTKLKNLQTGEVLHVKFRAAERLQFAEVEKIEMIYLYKYGTQYVLMDSSGCESIELPAGYFGENVDLLCEGLGGIATFRHNKKIIRVDLPITVDVLVKETPPDERGDTSSGSGKQATLTSGAIIIVPFHVKAGDKIRVDTRTRQYITRVNE